MWFVNLRGVTLCTSANDQAGELVAGPETGMWGNNDSRAVEDAQSALKECLGGFGAR
jgi:hypothetical protein